MRIFVGSYNQPEFVFLFGKLQSAVIHFFSWFDGGILELIIAVTNNYGSISAIVIVRFSIYTLPSFFFKKILS